MDKTGYREPDVKSIGIQAKTLTNLVMRFLDSEAVHEGFDDTTGTNGWILRYIEANDGKEIYQRDVEKHFCITRSTASKVIGLMEQKGYIERERAKGDARLRRLSLTERSRDLLEHMRKTGEKAERTLAAGLSEAEIEEYFRITNIMKENMKNAVEKDKLLKG